MWALLSWNNVLGVRRAFRPISFSSSITDAFLHYIDKVRLESWSGSLCSGICAMQICVVLPWVPLLPAKPDFGWRGTGPTPI